MYRTIFPSIFVLFLISSVHTLSLSSRLNEGLDFLCVIGYFCPNEHKCDEPAFGKTSEDDHCSPIETRNIFGYDDRVAVTSTQYPWRAIGKLSTGCTGTLVVCVFNYILNSF